MHIWQKLRTEIIEGKDLKTGKVVREPRPLIVLAPMADVTDIAFRTLIAEKGNPDMMWTEFVSADGIVRATPEGKQKLMKDLLFGPSEHPIVAQLFGSHPEYMEQASYLVASMGYDGIDINMGCPDKSIEKQGAGSGMIKTPDIAIAIIKSAKEGAKRAFEDGKGVVFINQFGKKETRDEPIPISVKTRIGYSKNQLDTWIPALLSAYPALITVHARTRKELSLVPARWNHVHEAVKIRDIIQSNMSPFERTLIIGNGDVQSVSCGIKKSIESGADGAMLGRALFGNPWLFSPLSHIVHPDRDPHNESVCNIECNIDLEKNNKLHIENDYNEEVWKSYEPTIIEKLDTAIAHTSLFVKYLGDTKNFAITKKHFKAYIQGFDGAKELRTELMDTATNLNEVRAIIEKFKTTHLNNNSRDVLDNNLKNSSI